MRYGLKEGYGINTEYKIGDGTEVKRENTNDYDEKDILSVDRLKKLHDQITSFEWSLLSATKRFQSSMDQKISEKYRRVGKAV